MASTSAAALSASGTASGTGPSSIGSTMRSSSGGRSSMAEATTHRLSIGNRRLSQLPARNNNALTALLSLPQFDSDEMHAHAAAFINEFNSYTQKTKAKITESSEQWDRETAELQEHDRALRKDLKVATLQEAGLEKALNREKEEAGNMSKTIQQLSARREEMRQMQASLESQVSLLRREVKAKREAKFAQKKALDEQILKNKPEVSCYESVLAMRIVGVQEDRIGFVFTRINEQDWDQEFAITIDVSQYDYSASECVPSLPELPSLVRYLNDTRDLYGFLKRVRKGFKDLCKK
ncbi:kinetochore-associated Ndc80 complex subunit spc25 [Mortierella antarctica]|nr:kinetochore-associated Ndc80 complex subunit spc25 [Mortierella alpina]KAF9988774.1 kinetochore-associated Ndc80 complex subunit spc25 [Mortierella antarctica]